MVYKFLLRGIEKARKLAFFCCCCYIILALYFCINLQSGRSSTYVKTQTWKILIYRFLKNNIAQAFAEISTEPLNPTEWGLQDLKSHVLSLLKVSEMLKKKYEVRRKKRASKPNVELICLVSLLWTSRQNSHERAQIQNAMEMQMSVECVLLKHLSGQIHQEGFSSHQPFASLKLKSCHFHENASPSSERYPKSLWAQRGPYSSQAYCLYHRIRLCFCCNLIYFFADILEMYFFPAGNHFLLGAFFIIISKKGKSWVNHHYTQHTCLFHELEAAASRSCNFFQWQLFLYFFLRDYSNFFI